MNKKIVIIKNGYDVLRIIEGKSDGDTCEFKIIFMIDNDNIEICYLQLFSDIQKLEFDKSKKMEITYHKSTISKPAKIHLKLHDKETGKCEYVSLPLKELIDPDVNTEIPIPLFKIIIPDNVLKTKYIQKKDHVVFDVEDNNMVEIFLTQNGFTKKNYHQKWDCLNQNLISTGIEFYATGLTEYFFINDRYNLGDQYDIHNVITREASTVVDITDDIGIQINKIRNQNLKEEKLRALFIENSIYLGFLAGMATIDYKHMYLVDFKNDKYFNDKERKKWEYRFNKIFYKTDRLIQKNKVKYAQMIKKYENLEDDYSQIRSKAEKFMIAMNKLRYDTFKKLNLINKDDENLIYNLNFFNKEHIHMENFAKIDMSKLEYKDIWFLEEFSTHARELVILFAKYLGEDEADIFCSTIETKGYNENNNLKLNNELVITTTNNLKIENVIYVYKKYSIELLRGKLNVLSDDVNEPNVLVESRMSYEDYKKYGYPKCIVDKGNFEVKEMEMYHISKENFEIAMKNNDCLLEKIYSEFEKIIGSTKRRLQMDDDEFFY